MELYWWKLETREEPGREWRSAGFESTGAMDSQIPSPISPCFRARTKLAGFIAIQGGQAETESVS